MEPELTELSRAHWANSIQSQLTESSRIHWSQLRIRWNQSSHNRRKPTEQAQNSTAPEHTESSRTHQENFKLNKQNSLKLWARRNSSAGGQASLSIRLSCAVLPPVPRPSCLTPNAHRTASRPLPLTEVGSGLNAPPPCGPQAHPLASPEPC